MQSQLEGQQIGRYLIRHRLGGGGAATVYQAYDQVNGQAVALKLLPPNPDPATLDRFRREALKAGAVRHPNIVRVLQVGAAADSSQAYIAMELVEGESLADLLARDGQLRPEESCLLLEPVARALAFAHDQGVVHRDVKPSNILLRPIDVRPGGNGSAHSVNLEALPHPIVPLLSDFGIARDLDMPELTNAGRTVGTPAFMSPEQCMGSREIDGRADIYSLGTVLYRCVTGRLPFSGSTTQILHAHVFEPVVIDEQMARTLPPAVVEILQRTLAKAPDARYQSADELASALAAAGAAANGHSSAHGAAAAAQGVEAATATMAQLDASPPTAVPERVPAVQVLVPGTTSVETPPVRDREAVVARSRGPNWVRVLWAAFFVLLIGGGGLWSASTWFRQRSRQEGEQLTLPPIVLVTFTPTPPATASQPGLADEGTPVGLAQGTAGPQATSPASQPPVTAVATATAAPQPTNTPIPTPNPTQAPAVTPTAAPVLVEVPAPTVTVAATVEPTPTEEVAGVCAMVIDEFFLPDVAQLSGELQSDFSCPTAPSYVAQGAWMPFAQGMMVAIEGEPLIYVYYANGTWEQVPRPDGEAAPDDASGEGAIPNVPQPFYRVLSEEGRHVLLGDPLQAEPLRGETVIQPFSGGLALGLRSSDACLFLARAKLKF